MPRRKAPSKASLAELVWRFGDGDDAMPLVDYELQLLIQHARMAESDDPDMRAAGMLALRRAAELVAGAKLAARGGSRGGAPRKSPEGSDSTFYRKKKGT